MRTLLLTCAGLLVISGIVSTNLWLELRSQHKLTAALQTQLAEANNRIRAATASPRAVANSLPAAAPGPALNPVLAVAEAKPVTIAAPPLPPNQAQARLNAMKREVELWRDPEYRKARVAQARANLQRQNVGLAEELGLNDRELDNLLDLLAEHQVSMNSEMAVARLNAQDNPAAQQELVRRQQEMTRQPEEALRNLLGGSRYSQYQQFQQNAGARNGVTTMNNTLARAGAPLNAVQIKSLTTIIAGEQQRLQQEILPLRQSVNPQDVQAARRISEELQRREAENRRRILEAAAPILSAQQLATLRTEMEAQEAASRASSRMQERTQALGTP
jgi:hypothetical protein